MLVSLPFAWMYLIPGAFVDFSKSILYSLGFSSNFYFWHSGERYGAESGLLKPFLHTWSLSVEEQFYILFPIVLFVTFKYFRKYLIHILILGFIISLGFADWSSRNHQSFNFYMLPTRGWELLAGSILAYFEIIKGHRSKNKLFNLTLPTIGLLLIGQSILFFSLPSWNDKMFHPSFYTLSPIIGVCLIIWFSNKDEIITKILSTKLFVGIGLISYSLYLWHYPIFTFSRITNFFYGDIFNKLLLGLILIILSIISYHLIEKPFRNKKYKFKILFILILFSIFMLFFGNLNIIFKDGYKNRVPEILRDLTKNPWNLLKNSDNKICFSNMDMCEFNISSNKKVFIIGDSHMASIMFDLKKKIVKSQYQFITSTHSGCLYFPGFNKTDKNKFCNDNYFQKLKDKLSKEKNSVIIFGGYLPSYFDDIDKFVSLGKYDTPQQSFRNETLELSNNNKIILIYPIPELFFLNLNLKLVNQWRKKGSPKFFDIEFFTTSYKFYKERTKSSFELLDSIQGENIYRVYPHTLFCNTTIKNRCVTHDDKNIFYFDHNHPSLKGSEMINDLLMKEIEKIESKSN